MTATQLTSRKILGLNQRTYQHLKLALGLNLRRQILIAVGDDIGLQNQLADQLEADMAQPLSANRPEGIDPRLGINPDELQCPRLERLIFEADVPDLPAQILKWLQQASTLERDDAIPNLQILGIEQMTRQPAMLQHQFLQSLNKIETLLPCLESSLLIWLPWPWFRAIQQSAPQFWQWRSRVFEFSGDPTPILEHPNDVTARKPEAASQEDSPPSRPAGGRLYGEPLMQSASDPAATSSAPPTVQHLWQVLAEDLAGLDNRIEAAAIVTEPLEPSNADTICQPSSPPLDSSPLAPSRASVRIQSAPSTAAKQIAQADRYRDRIESGEARPELIDAAIAAYEAGLQGLSQQDAAWCISANDLGTLYWLKAQQSQDRQSTLSGMQRSAQIYHAALKKVNRQLQSPIAIRLYSNLGAVFSAIASYDESAAALKHAVNAYRQALTLCSAEHQPEEYALLQNSLGSVYWQLSHHENGQFYLHRAIAAYNEALRSYHPEKAPLDYAAVQNNLGITYWSLSKHERPVFLLKHAIAAYRDALNYRTPHTDPTACASTYSNLGSAYWDLANQYEPAAPQQQCYQQNAVLAYEASLAATARAPQPMSGLDPHAIHHCLGKLHEQLAQAAAANTGQHLQQSLHHYLEAISGQTAEASIYQTLLQALVSNLQMHYEILGLEGQQQALTHLPPELLPEVLKHL
ncbi:tetratricopeptide repeat protein [Romeria aff. gracilis LEGE 07310]|uniref:Tetratricopeptide repeat protein n=1 Tax=Vasconcelosia minhoensis LEGE 07310 TaxID=915328 RepID=A0A8J7DQF0_9CYAN|nr:tetratricopeptide repeat protein [Romeria gracilis]MBE9076459.1 tetratricopeptide repeat protein [Romeria aff. gracilis LEGE 07310]